MSSLGKRHGQLDTARIERIHLREIWSGPEMDISFNNEQEVETVNLRYLHWMNFKSGDWIAIDI